MESVVEREHIIQKIEEILQTKNFSDEIKSYFQQTLLLIYDHFLPPLSVKISKREYIEQYLEILKQIGECSILSLEELNTDKAEVFREGIKESNQKNGNLDYVDGYVPVKEGPYYLSFKGYGWKKEGHLFIMNEGNSQDVLLNCYHQMTLLALGSNPFWIPSSFPFSASFRKLFYEGYASLKDQYLDIKSSNYQVETIKENKTTLKVCSSSAYPLYEVLYQMLELIFGLSTLEELSQNEKEISLFEQLKDNFPDIPTEEIFAHIIYILSYYGEEREEVKRKILKETIKHYNVMIEAKKETNLNKQEALKTTIEEHRNWLEDNKKIMQDILDQLDDPKRLEQALEYQMKLLKEEALKKLEQGLLTEEEYQVMIKEYDEQGTLENFRLAQKQDLKMMTNTLKEGEEKLASLETELRLLRETEDTFGTVLEEVCLTNPSLERSCEFLKQTCLSRIREKQAELPLDEDSENNINLEEMKVFMHLKSRMIISDK